MRNPFIDPAVIRGRFISSAHFARNLTFWGSGETMEESIFRPYIVLRPIFKMDRDILRPAFVPDRLPHREEQVDQLAQILSTALRGERPSNVLIFGKTGTGKTAVVKYIENELKKLDGGRTVHYVYMNCEIVDTPYGVLQNVANRFVENLSQ